MIITITGTPGAGKTHIAKGLANKNWKYIDLNALIKKEKLYDCYDKKADTFDVDTERLKKLDERFSKYIEKEISVKKELTAAELKNIIKKNKGILVDSHLSHYLNSDLCIVVKADIKTINNRLKKRGYPVDKIKENIESEIFDICLEEATALNRNISVIRNG